MTNWLKELEAVEFAGAGRPDAVSTVEALAILKRAQAEARDEALEETWCIVDRTRVEANLKGDHPTYDLCLWLAKEIRALKGGK